MVEFTLLIPIWLPLIVGTLWIGSSMIRDQAVTQMARDLASMYSRDSTNLNFLNTDTTSSTTTATNAALNAVTGQIGSLDPATGTGVVFFSSITYVGNSFCAEAGNPAYGTLVPLSHTGACTNYGSFVFTQQYVLGNTSLMAHSRFGTASGPFDNADNILPSDSVTASGNVANFTLIQPVPAETGSDGYQSGQRIYVVEVYFKNHGLAGYTGGGDYAYAVF
jgi:hypothetical protein